MTKTRALRDDREVPLIVEESYTVTYILLTAIIFLLGCLVVGVVQVKDSIDKLISTVEQLRLSGRTVQRQAVMRDGELTEERVLTRLARSSKSRRIVVGGDDDSELNQDLARGMHEDDDDDE